MEKNEFKKFRMKNRTCYYFDDIIKLQDFDIDNISIHQKSFMVFHIKLKLVQNLCKLDSIK